MCACVCIRYVHLPAAPDFNPEVIDWRGWVARVKSLKELMLTKRSRGISVENI